MSGVSAGLKAHAQVMAEEAGRPFIYLASSHTKAQGRSKEDRAREIVREQSIEEGLVCVFSVLERCRSFTVRGNRQTHRLEVVRQDRKCLHFYFYWMDPEFGLMHVRLQSWFPFEIQVWINGREWLARQLDSEGIGYVRYENTFLGIDDLDRARALCERFARRKWPRVLDALARKVNPMLSTIRESGFGGYYWVVDQAEYATDVMFRDRASLEALYPALLDHGLTFGADDVFRFLGRKLNGNFKGEVTSDLKRRVQGRRIKHRMKENSLKMYDKASVLRVETTINNPREFRVLRVRTDDETGQRSRRWMPMGKGVANFWRYSQVAQQSNERYLEAMACAQPKGEAVAELDRLCRPRVVRGTRYVRFQPVSPDDCALFRAVLHGDHAIRGFRNGDLQSLLYASPPRSKAEQRKRNGRPGRTEGTAPLEVAGGDPLRLKRGGEFAPSLSDEEPTLVDRRIQGYTSPFDDRCTLGRPEGRHDVVVPLRRHLHRSRELGRRAPRDVEGMGQDGADAYARGKVSEAVAPVRSHGRRHFG